MLLLIPLALLTGWFAYSTVRDYMYHVISQAIYFTRVDILVQITKDLDMLLEEAFTRYEQEQA